MLKDLGHPSVLAGLGGTLHERFRGDWRDWHGFTHASGGFAGQLIGLPLKFSELSQDQLKTIAAIAAGFTALLSLFNIGGRIAWASLSDRIGRKATYSVFFILGAALYAFVPFAAQMESKLLFVGAICIIISMYGGGFATVPAYLADLFGTQMVGAIHGRLLTAWATAGILGPVIVNNMRDYQLGLGLAASQVYNQTMFILAGLLIVGLICNLCIRPVNPKYFMTPAELEAEQKVPKNIMKINKYRVRF